MAIRWRFAFTTDDFSVLMDRKGLRPIGLPNVVVLLTQTELVRQGELAWEDDLQRALTDLKHSSWGTWLRKKVKGMLGGEVRTSNYWYHRNSLNTRCREVMEWVKTEKKVSVVTEAQVTAYLHDRALTDKEVQMVLAQLQVAETASAHVLSVGVREVPVLKFRVGGELSERDVSFVTASIAKEDLERRISEVEGRRTEAKQTVERLMKERNKTSKG